MRVVISYVFAVVLLVSTVVSAKCADIHALVVGVDEYDENDRLEGAVADANDISSAITRLAPKSLTTLRNSDATRARILAGLAALERAAKPGDVVVFTYAGHGGREPWRGLNGRIETAETFLLSGFSPRAKRYSEKILDKEINAWLSRMASTRAKVVFVADSCHAGGMTRSFDERAGRLTVRSAPYALPDTLISSAELQKSNASLAAMPHVTFLAATQEDRLTPEVLIDGKKRGALSYAFARALEGAADPDRKGVLTYLGLARFVIAQVRQLSEARQTPEVVYRSGGDDDAVLSGLPQAPPAESASRLRLKLLHAPATAGSGLRNVEIVNDNSAALVWDARLQSVVSSHGDQVAESIRLDDLQGVIDKWRALEELKKLGASHSLKLDLRTGDQKHAAGSVVKFESEPLAFSHVTAVNIAPDGSLQFLGPLRDDIKEYRLGTSYTLEARVRAPFGADHLVVLATKLPPNALRAQLARSIPVSALPKLISDTTAGAGFQLGLIGLYTTDTAR